MDRNTLQLILIFVVIIIAGYYGFSYFKGSGADIEENTVMPQLQARLEELRRVKTIKLDTSIFQDSFFKSLTLPKPIPQPEVKFGRDNPFLPFR